MPSDDNTSTNADNPLAISTLDNLRSLGILGNQDNNDPNTSPLNYTVGPKPDTSVSQVDNNGNYTNIDPGSASSAGNSFQPINPYISAASGPGGIPPINADQVQQAPSANPVNPASTPVTQDSGAPPNKLGDVASTSSQLSSAMTGEANASKVAATDQYNAENAKNARLNSVNADYINSLTQNDQQHQQAREQAHQEAAIDTANWMQNMDKQVAEKPSSGNWWHDQSGFGKALWLLGLAFGAKSQSLGGKNTVADMINQEIDNDMKRQQEIINKKGENLRNKGKIMLEGQTQKLNDINDDYTHRVGRIGALMEANKVRAAQATTDDLKATYSKADAFLAGKKTEVAKDRYDNSVKERLNVVDQQYESGRENVKLLHESNENILNRQQQSSENALERQNKRDLAEEKVAGQLAAAEKKAQNKQDLHEFPIQSGINLTVPDEQGKSKVTTFAVPKDQAEAASKIVQSNQAKIVALSKLRDELSKSDLPYGTFENNNEGRQRLAAIVDPIVKQVGGRFSPDNAKLVTDMILGEDPSSLWQRAKGSSTQDIVKMLNREIQEAPGYAKQQLLGIPGSNLADHPEANLVFTAPDTTGPGEHEYTPDEKYESATGKAAPPVKLDGQSDIEQFGDVAHDQLPSELKKAVDDAKQKFETGLPSKEDIQGIKDQAYKNIADHNKKSPDSKEKDIANNNATKLIDDAQDRAIKVAERLPEIKAKLATETGWSGKPDIKRKELEEELTRAHLVIPESRVQSILKDINEIRSKMTFDK